MSAVCTINFHPSEDDRDRIAAGQAALRRAQTFGYGRNAQTALMREAKRQHVPGHDPEYTARNVVAAPHEPACFRGPAPRGAA